MTRVNRTTPKKNIGYETRVIFAKDCSYFHINKDCSLVKENIGMVYKELPISQVPKSYKVCPNCGKDWK